MKMLTMLVIAALLTVVLLTAGCTEDDNGDEEQLETAPNFTLTSIDNDTFSLSEFQGKVVILDFMATWCGPCKTQMDHLKQVFSNYGENQVVIMSIDIDEEETDEELRTFGEDWGDDWIYAVDKNGDVQDNYSVGPIPKMVIINKDGKIAFEHVGVVEYDTLSSKINEYL